jgi:hypothetical protein
MQYVVYGLQLTFVFAKCSSLYDDTLRSKHVWGIT